ncbi:hypothetical protein PMI41_02799 [Phyllobacterium sp. YR531]|nr:hypothetical protein PMI41_02799 [Phyllobacterium sp. YR531]
MVLPPRSAISQLAMQPNHLPHGEPRRTTHEGGANLSSIRTFHVAGLNID